MKQFFGAFLGSLFAAVFIFFMFIFLIVIATPSEEAFKIENNSILKINLTGEITDQETENPLKALNFLTGEKSDQLNLNDLLKTISAAKSDEKIDGIVLYAEGFNAGYATLREVRNALIDFQESGKYIWSYGDLYTQKAYYLCSVSDSIFINRSGLVEWSGIGYSSTYLKDGLDKLGVKAELIRGSNNKFKSAGEPYIKSEMSDENRLQVRAFIGDIWKTMTDDIAKDGRLTSEELNALANESPIYSAKEARKRKLVDAVVFEDEFLKALSGEDIIDPDDINFVSFGDYQSVKPSNISKSKDRIAIIFAEGEINMGKSSEGSMGAETMVKAIRDVRSSDKIKAVVLRINSPGGSALASDLMWRELTLLAKEKPLIVSMGNLAASGGYYIAAPADSILVSPSTITGSIGVFGLFFTAEELMHEKLGLRSYGEGTNTYSNFGQIDRDLTPAERAIVQAQVDETYGQFLGIVAKGRNLDSLFVDEIAQGRVWSGEDAIENGLADAYGELNDAIAIAAAKAGLEEYRISEYPKQKTAEELIQELFGMSASSAIESELGPIAPAYHYWNRIKNMQGVQARMESDFQIR